MVLEYRLYDNKLYKLLILNPCISYLTFLLIDLKVIPI